jgi:hypothetical protein
MPSVFISLATSLFVSQDLLDHSSKTDLDKMLVFVYSSSTIKLAHK